VKIRQWLGIFLAVSGLAGLARAETIELVTYYPSNATTGDLHVTSLTVGTAYNGETPADGQAFIFDRLGIGPGFTAAEPPREVLEVVGNILANGPAGSDALFIADRPTNTRSNGLQLRTNGTPQWSLGSRGDGMGTENFQLFSNADNATRLFVEQGTGNVGIGTAEPNASSLLEMNSTTKGFLPPRMTTAQRNAIAAPAAGLLVFNTSTGRLNYYDGAQWVSGAGGTTATARLAEDTAISTPVWGPEVTLLTLNFTSTGGTVQVIGKLFLYSGGPGYNGRASLYVDGGTRVDYTGFSTAGGGQTGYLSWTGSLAAGNHTFTLKGANNGDAPNPIRAQKDWTYITATEF